jgi:hypothetical protein
VSPRQPAEVSSRTPLLVSLAAVAVMVVVDLVMGRPIPGFWALFGFVSCTILILATKVVGKRFLLRDPGYYEPSGPGRVPPEEHAAEQGGGR